MAESSKISIYAALAGNLAIAVTKFAAALATGSSSMLTESVHSLVDTGNQGLLLYGIRRARTPPDEVHPFGYGRELYFWSFVVALLIFAGGAGVSIYEGVVHIQSPEPLNRPWINFAVLGASFLFEGGSWLVAFREFRTVQGELGWWQAIRRSKDPASFAVLFEDSAALLGILIAALFIALAVVRNDPRLDGVGSILIGIVLAIVAMLLARECKGLLIGERARPEVSAAIRKIACAAPGVLRVIALTTIHLAPDQIIVTISLEFDDDLRTPDIERSVEQIEQQAKAEFDDVRTVFIRPQSGAGSLRRTG